MRRISLWIVVLLLLTVSSGAQDIKLPVFFLRYDGGTQFEEPEEEEEESVLDYQRHKITFRIKEQWSDGFTTNLYTVAFAKFATDANESYTYFYLNPNYVWDVSDRLRWTSEFRSKWKWDYDTGGSDYVLDLTSLRVKTELTYKILEQLKIIPSFQGVFDLSTDPYYDRQIYTAGMRFESRIKPQLRLNGRYRLILPAPLGLDSTFTDNEVEHEFGVNLSWDPNK